MSNSTLNIPLHLIPEKDTAIYLAISGGVDSIVLLHLLSKFENPIHLLHVNYHLRGEDSNADEALVRKQAKNYNAEITVLDFDMQKHLDENGGNLQSEARNIRYSFFEKHLINEGVLMTAHHFDDQTETFFMHLSRKSGIAGMSCMLEQNNNHVRPLLQFRKSELYDFAEKEGIEFREDVSNKENKYLRNQWRNVWIPEIEKEIPSLANSIQILIEAFQTERSRLEIKYQSELDIIETTRLWSFESFDKMCTEGKHIVARKFGIRPSELIELLQLRNAEKSKKLVIVRQDLTIWNDGKGFILEQRKGAKIPEIVVENVTDLPSIFDKETIYLDADKIVGKLKLRPWNSGDRISSIGVKGTQLVSDIIKDAKVSPDKKASVLVLVDDEKIIWVHGLKIGRTALASEKSSNILKIFLDLYI